MVKKGRHIRFVLLLAAMVLSAGCTYEEPPQPETQPEIRLDATVWQMMQGAPALRAMTYDNAAALQGEANGFRVFIYNDGTTTSYNSEDGSVVKWVTDEWVFQDGKHYWPASGSLDFFAYMPASAPDYITDLTYTATSIPSITHNVSFNCTLPMTYNSASPTEGQGSDLKEFIYALTTGQDKEHQGASGVTMTFKHPFARIKFQLSASHPDIKVDTITFKGLKTGGTYSFDGSTSAWSELTPAETTTSFKAILNQECYDNPVTTVALGPDFLVVPQEWAGEIEVKASWNDWGDTPVPHTVTTTIPAITWQAGKSYTYTFTITPEDLVVNTTNFTEQW